MKTSTRIVKCKSNVVKSNPVVPTSNISSWRFLECPSLEKKHHHHTKQEELADLIVFSCFHVLWAVVVLLIGFGISRKKPAHMRGIENFQIKARDAAFNIRDSPVSIKWMQNSTSIAFFSWVSIKMLNNTIFWWKHVRRYKKVYQGAFHKD